MHLAPIHPFLWLIISLVVFLMIINWGIEARKWQFMIAKIEEISFINAFLAVFSGITVSIFTPNRIGEYFGRVFILKKSSPGKGIVITILGSLSQFFITIIAGSIALIFFLDNYTPFSLYLGGFLIHGIAVAVLLLNMGIVLLFINTPLLISVMNRIIPRSFWKFKNYLRVIGRYNKSELLKVLWLSALRYMVFSCQYLLLFKAAGIPLNFFEGIIAVAVIFFILTAIPSMALAELGIRSSVALGVIKMILPPDLASNESISIGIVASASLVYIINIALPALLGSAFVVRLRFFKKSRHELN
jgi:uncharacterized membrane protein YbhN (UPF0104 family)